MEGGTDQDYDEFEMLLGEIPNATSGNPHSEDSGRTSSSVNMERIPRQEGERKCSPSASFTNFYNASQAASSGSNSTFYDGLAFERTSANCVNPSQCSTNQKLQINGNLDGGKIIVKSAHQSPVKNVDQDDSNLPDDQSLNSAFADLSFKDGMAVEAPTSQFVKHNTLQNCTFLLDGQYPNCLKKSLSSLGSGATVIPTPPNAPSGMNVVNGLNKLDIGMSCHENTKLLKLNVQELKKQNPGSHQLLENLSGDIGEQLQSAQVYSPSTPLAAGLHAFQVVPNITVPGVEFPVTPFQQQCFLDTQSPLPYMQPQPLNQPHITWRQLEEERYCRMHQQYLYLQQLCNQGSDGQVPTHASRNAAFGSMTRDPRRPYFEIPISLQLEQGSQGAILNGAVIPRGLDSSDPTLTGTGPCRYYAQGFCGRGETCPFAHGPKQSSASSLGCHPSSLTAKDFGPVKVLDKVVKQNFPEKILTRSHGLNSIRTIKPCSDVGNESLSHGNSNGRLLFDGHFQYHPSILNAASFQLDGRNSHGSSPDTVNPRHINLKSPSQKYNSVDEVMGRIYLMAKDQHGCRFLQRKFTEGTKEDIDKIFLEIIGHIVELMTDPFGNYLIQKLLEVCDEDQRMQILHAITRKAGDLVRISCDMHGTRAVQKVIETLNTPEQFSMVVSSLKPGIVMLIKNMNGNHVAARCLQHLMPEYCEFLFEAATGHCVELATDRHGCCVLQKCLGHSDGEQRRRMICEITSNALLLSQDPFGNYVVQYVFELRMPWATMDVLNQLEGNYAYLSMQKYSSNVVEKCLKYAAEEHRPQIIQELINTSRLDQILQDPYGNYVIQAALNHSKGTLHAALVEAIRPHVPALRTSPYGKKVLSCNNLKK
ncbi:PREDICTED: uncharacterized protein LOC104597686 [Nelumbo nucifera]|uniref:Uncharacterized protein LOC104597686 n=2 Tax=Nelumbo nucifera TaxID=4432 RepID=A0A1U8A725_NELNU|nr:PREDICTED: uncharacterized protein LOC104597686 [Nelumbo nucifera]DAD42068.1 TPA_asm: hypothetical protein HUJ06_000298 [Nelumbo nucifera]